MKRLLGSVLAVLALIAAVAALVGSPARSADSYRVDVIFDTAKGIIPGQSAKIAGARVGSIQDVKLTKDYKARIVLQIPRRFSFRTDASCNIQPEGLISENFVQCDPGTPSKDVLRGKGDQPPTVPVDHTSVPVNLTDLFRIFRADVRQRFTVAVAALGGGLAARGDDLNQILLRANPTLQAFRRLSRTLADEKAQLVSAVDDTDTVIASLTRNRSDVTEFLDQTAAVTRHTANRRADLSEAIRRLPALLDAAGPAVKNLNRLAVRGQPLLRQLREATPALLRLIPRIKPFAAAGTPAVKELGRFGRQAQPALLHAQPLVDNLRQVGTNLPEAGRSLASTLVDLRDSGFVENLNLFAYYGSSALSRFDSQSHIFASAAEVNTCSGYTTTAVPGCNGFYNQSSPPARSLTGKARSTTASRNARPSTPSALKPVQALTEQLQRGLGGALPPQLRDVLRRPQASDGSTVRDLADFLLGS